jgi:prostaglandin-endoperoxide synthase 1/linoleate 10R-lipoxygenase
MEGIRLAGTFGSCREAIVDDVIREDDGSEIAVKAKDRVFISFVSPRTIRPLHLMHFTLEKPC